MIVRVLSSKHSGIAPGDTGTIDEVMLRNGEVIGYGVRFEDVKHQAALPLIERKPAIIFMLPNEVENIPSKELMIYRKMLTQLNGKDKDG